MGGEFLLEVTGIEDAENAVVSWGCPHSRTAGIDSLNSLEARSPRARCQQGRFLLGAVGEGAPGLSPQLVDGPLLPVSSLCQWLCPNLLIRTPAVLN